MLVFEDSEYGHTVSIEIGTLHLDKIIDLISKDEIHILTCKWQSGCVAILLANTSDILKTVGTGHFSLYKVKSAVKSTQAVEVPFLKPFTCSNCLMSRGMIKEMLWWLMHLRCVVPKQLLQSQDIVTYISTQDEWVLGSGI